MKKYKELTFTDDFLFCKNTQQTIDITSDGKGVRLDVYLEDDKNTVYDVEMQTTDARNLPKRTRYYQGMIDLNLIEKGEDYNKLKKSYVIFICTFDPFGFGRHIYTFENMCVEESRLRLEDECAKIFLNSNGYLDDVDDELKAFLKFLATGISESELTENLEKAVDKAKFHERWEVEFMTLFMRDKENQERGRIEGRASTIIQSVDSVMKNLNLSVQETCEALGVTEEEYRSAKELIKSDLNKQE